MTKLNPRHLFERISEDIPSSLHGNVIVTGSLAAAYKFQAALDGNAVNTKDADLVVHPAGEEKNCADMTRHLLQLGWKKTESCYPMQAAEPAADLRAIRLYPPKSTEYFVEFLNVPSTGQVAAKEWIPMQMDDGWYGLPSFRFLSVVAVKPNKSDYGIEYARASMMALANLLAHPAIGISEIESGTMRGRLRSGKDLGRVIALAFLTGRNETETWIDEWSEALHICFADLQYELATSLGDGLRELIKSQKPMADAHQTAAVGLLSGMNVTSENMQLTAERLLADVIEPVQAHFASSSGE